MLPRTLHINKFCLTIILLICSFEVYSQQAGRMETDRPDQTESPFITKRGYIQNETGFNKNNISNEKEYFLPTHLIKYGLHKNLELRYTFMINSKNKITKYNSETLGMKLLLTEGKGIIPKTSIIAHYHIGDLKRDLTDLNRMPHSIADFVFTSQNEITKNISVGYNYGVEFHTNGKHEGIFRVAPGMNIGERFYSYVEIFGRFPLKKYNDTWIDGGLAYYINDNVKIDFSAGTSINLNNNYYLAIGLSTRTKLIGRD